mgnify:CR=1 FL=1
MAAVVIQFCDAVGRTSLLISMSLMPALLASGEISVGVSYTTDLPANAKCKKLRDIPCKVLRGDGGS